MLPQLTATDLSLTRASLQPSLAADDFDLSEDVSSATELADNPILAAPQQPSVTHPPQANLAQGLGLELNSFDDSW
eukprot:m.13182 g.13182  ORF g.13182 m.13182 type:complete len:76 (-) comp10111_c0_seq1:1206-1433(-)